MCLVDQMYNSVSALGEITHFKNKAYLMHNSELENNIAIICTSNIVAVELAMTISYT